MAPGLASSAPLSSLSPCLAPSHRAGAGGASGKPHSICEGLSKSMGAMGAQVREQGWHQGKLARRPLPSSPLLVPLTSISWSWQRAGGISNANKYHGKEDPTFKPDPVLLGEAPAKCWTLLAEAGCAQIFIFQILVVTLCVMSNNKAGLSLCAAARAPGQGKLGCGGV